MDEGNFTQAHIGQLKRLRIAHGRLFADNYTHIYNEKKNWHVTIFENMMIIHLGMSVYVLVGHEKW